MMITIVLSLLLRTAVVQAQVGTYCFDGACKCYESGEANCNTRASEGVFPAVTLLQKPTPTTDRLYFGYVRVV